MIVHLPFILVIMRMSDLTLGHRYKNEEKRFPNLYALENEAKRDASVKLLHDCPNSW